MKFNQFTSDYKRKNLIQKFHKNCHLRLQRITCNLYWRIKFFEVSCLYYICMNKGIKRCPNQHAELLKFLFREYSLIIKKGLELVSRSHFSYNFLIKIFLLYYHINWSNSLPDCVYFPRCSVKCVLCFMLGHFMTSCLNIWKVKVWLSQEQKELLNETFFLISQVLSFTKTSKNVTNTTFNLIIFQ